MGALLSNCERYRCWLTRPTELSNPSRPPAFFVMLNPATADSEVDDNTIRRCRGFARTWGCDGLVVANLYAFRTPYPEALFKEEDPVGVDNDYWLLKLAKEHRQVVCAWGANARADRVQAFWGLMQAAGAQLRCLRITKAGTPGHPLYIPGEQPLMPWPGPK